MEFESFVADADPRLRRAYLGTLGADRALDAVAEALAFAWEEWATVSSMSNPVDYLYRVGKSRTRSRKQPVLPEVLLRSDQALFEPALPVALMLCPMVSERRCGWLTAVAGRTGRLPACLM